MSLPFNIAYDQTVVAQVLTGKLVALVAGQCPAGSTLTIQHPNDCAEVLIEATATTREKNKLAKQLEDWANALQPAGEVIEIAPAAAPAEQEVAELAAAPTPAEATKVEEVPTIAEVKQGAQAAVEVRKAQGNEVANEIKDAGTSTERIKIPLNSIVKMKSGRVYCARVEHFLAPGAEIIGDTPHFDGDYSYRCGKEDCQCAKNS